jgi:hypothetical protein
MIFLLMVQILSHSCGGQVEVEVGGRGEGWAVRGQAGTAMLRAMSAPATRQGGPAPAPAGPSRHAPALHTASPSPRHTASHTARHPGLQPASPPAPAPPPTWNVTFLEAPWLRMNSRSASMRSPRRRMPCGGGASVAPGEAGRGAGACPSARGRRVCGSRPRRWRGAALQRLNACTDRACVPAQPARTCTVGIRGSFQPSTRLVSTNQVSLRLESSVLTKLSLRAWWW